VRSAVGDALGPASSAGRLHLEKDAQVGPSKPADSSGQGKSTTVKVLEEGTCALHEPVNMEVEVPSCSRIASWAGECDGGVSIKYGWNWARALS